MLRSGPRRQTRTHECAPVACTHPPQAARHASYAHLQPPTASIATSPCASPRAPEAATWRPAAQRSGARAISRPPPASRARGAPRLASRLRRAAPPPPPRPLARKGEGALAMRAARATRAGARAASLVGRARARGPCSDRAHTPLNKRARARAGRACTHPPQAARHASYAHLQPPTESIATSPCPSPRAPEAATCGTQRSGARAISRPPPASRARGARGGRRGSRPASAAPAAPPRRRRRARSAHKGEGALATRAARARARQGARGIARQPRQGEGTVLRSGPRRQTRTHECAPVACTHPPQAARHAPCAHLQPLTESIATSPCASPRAPEAATCGTAVGRARDQPSPPGLARARGAQGGRTPNPAVGVVEPAGERGRRGARRRGAVAVEVAVEVVDPPSHHLRWGGGGVREGEGRPPKVRSTKTMVRK